jgi:hypothetical protein
MLRFQALVFRAMLGLQALMLGAMLGSGHRSRVRCFVLRFQALVFRAMLRPKTQVLRAVLGLKAPVLGAVFLVLLIKGRGHRCSKQQSGERQHGQGHSL